jgi:type 1 glutamine amidotransferase
MKILVINGDNWHPPIISQKGLEALTNPAYDFTWANGIADCDPSKLRDFNILLLAKSNELSATAQKGWMQESSENLIGEYVQSGRGFLAIHSGIAEYDSNRMFRKMLGGIFHHHPDPCAVTINPKAGHPLAGGVHPFSEKDEHYFITMDDPTADVFLTADSQHGSQPAGWRRVEGKGRVAVITPGHFLEVWIHPDFQTLLRNVLNWCGGIA